MSLTVAVPFGIASAVVYGTSIVVQHRTAQQKADPHGASAAALLRLARSPVFLLAIAGDFVGFVLQIAALSAGPVVVIQPLVVLMLPVSLGVSYLLGGHRPRLGDNLGVIGVLGGLGTFLALVGEPGGGHVPKSRSVALAVLVVIAVSLVVTIAVTGRNRTFRGATYGAVAGICFGTLAVMVDASSDRVSREGLHGLLATPRGLVPFISVLVLGAGGIILTQMSFQVGALGATLPANLATDPLTAVLIGSLLLGEHIPSSPVHIVLYILCVVAVVAGAIRLADPQSGPLEPDLPAEGPNRPG